MHALIKPRHGRLNPHRQYRGGQRAAYHKALTAAKLYLGIPPQRPSSVREASEQCGANPAYTSAMITLLTAEDEQALDLVLGGARPLLETAAGLKPQADLIVAYRKANAAGHSALGRRIGLTQVWDDVIAPLI